jgi:RNA polymerase sigma factor (sigma-70 family)
MIKDELFSDEFVEKTFLFCYKRLFDKDDAADLAQSILLAALSALRNGRRIENFYAWYWKTARNMLCVFLKKQRVGAVSLDESGGALIPDLSDPCDSLVSDAEISALNLAVSRLSSLQRELVVMFYLKALPISEISKALVIPEGTVKRKLFDARNNIRKGLEKMDKTGRAAYAPAELNLWGTNNIPDYWNEIGDLITKQIFVVCSKKPASVSEIADEIGVAPVYFEEKLEYLLDNKFIKPSGNGRYLTDFCIYPAKVYDDFMRTESEIYQNIGPEITDAVFAAKKAITSINFYGNDFPFDYLLWLLYVYACDVLSFDMLSLYAKKWEGRVPENNGKNYRLAGGVAYPDEKLTPLKLKCVPWSNMHWHFTTAGYRQITYANLFQHAPFAERDAFITDKNINVIMKLYENPKAALTETEKEMVSALISRGLVNKSGDNLSLAMPVMTYNQKNEIEGILRYTVKPLSKKYVEAVSEAGEKYLLPHTRQDLLEEYAHWIMQSAFFPLSYVLYYGINTPGVLAIPEDYKVSAAGLCLYLKK